MRSAYGKLIYLLQDSANPEIQELLGFALISPIQTVHLKLEECGSLDMLDDELLHQATATILADGKTRPVIDREIKQKERAVEVLARKYSSAALSYDECKNCIASIGDSNAYLFYNRDPVIKAIELLQTHFRHDAYDEGFSLAIVAGHGGARLTHSHGNQFDYVLQSMTLWKLILHNMYKLWMLAQVCMLMLSG